MTAQDEHPLRLLRTLKPLPHTFVGRLDRLFPRP